MAEKKLKNKKIVVLGYGSQGRAIALNLRDSKCNVTIGLPSKSKSRKFAKTDRFSVTTTSNAVKQADILIFALPDHLQGRIYTSEIEPNLQQKTVLIFLHGFAIHFGFIKAPKTSEIFLLAPHAPGIALREKYLSDKSVSAFMAIENEKTTSKSLLIELAAAIGIQKNKLVQNSFKDEALGDLFGEQAVLCGGLSELIFNGYSVLLENGHNSDNAYLEVCYQLDLIIRLIKEYGIVGMYERISVAARYGSVENGKSIIDSHVKKNMQKAYKNIESGKFAKKINSLNETELKKLSKSLKVMSSDSFEKASKKFKK